MIADALQPNLEDALAACAERLETVLGSCLGPDALPGEIARPERLLEAMRYAVLGGGKRFRPFLLLEARRLFGAPRDGDWLVGAAIECVHGYSLVHDDLPAMDDDDLRRGRPTLHRAFDEASAILGGDALLTLAFDLLAREEAHPDPGVRSALVLDLARASGIGGMGGGQALDLAAEGRALDEDEVLTMQAMKTGALIRAACVMGGRLGGASAVEHDALRRYGERLGAIFQIADDLLDLEGSAEEIGKAASKDAARGKATLPALVGHDEARRRLARMVDEADAALEPFAHHAGGTLRAAARFAAKRRR